MSKVRIIFLVIITCISFISCETKNEKTHKKTQTEIINKKISSTFPFSEAAKIEIISFSCMDYRPEEVNYKIVNGKLPFDENIVKERILLNKNQEEELFSILNTDDCPEGGYVYDCYLPEHRIIFYDNNNKIIAFLEVCLQCVGSRISKGFKTVELCEDKMGNLEQFFESAGIKYFSEH